MLTFHYKIIPGSNTVHSKREADLERDGSLPSITYFLVRVLCFSTMHSDAAKGDSFEGSEVARLTLDGANLHLT